MSDNVKKLTDSYIHLKDTMDKLSHTLIYQKHIKQTGCIPRKYKPQNLLIAEPNNSKLQESFNSKYQQLFQEYLTNVIKENEITLEIKKFKLLNLIHAVEQNLITSQDSPSTVTSAYYYFIEKTKLKNHVPPPNLTKILDKAQTQTDRSNAASTHFLVTTTTTIARDAIQLVDIQNIGTQNSSPKAQANQHQQSSIPKSTTTPHISSTNSNNTEHCNRKRKTTEPPDHNSKRKPKNDYSFLDNNSKAPPKII